MDLITIDRGASASIQQQLYERLRTAIVTGKARAGERLPSTRSLAAQLNIARGTVDLAYARLAEEGYVTACGPRGTIVSPELDQIFFAKLEDARSAPAEIQQNTEYLLPFRFGVPALDLFPRKLWSRLAAREARRIGPPALPYPDPAGLPALREAITAYLAVSRGIVCSPGQIVVTTGYQGALNLVARLVLEAGDCVWLEDPCYGFALNALQALSMRIAPIPVDEQGLQVAYGRAYHPQARLAVVTPAHQFPLGCSLSLPRRQALLAWAAEQGSWIIEDDYDGEFHYSGHRPLPLKSIDAADCVFYAGSFSKTLFPSLRLGYVVVPAHFVEPATQACRLLHRGAGVFGQSVVAAFIAEGHFARHLRQMRSRYRARRLALADALDSQFGAGVSVCDRAGGLHILARFPNLGPDAELARRAIAHGLMPHPLSGQSIEHDAGHGLLMSFTNLPEEEAEGVVAGLYRAIT
jgi:GntR family transcriptional regulator/MocR family aminotransferase